MTSQLLLGRVPNQCHYFVLTADQRQRLKFCQLCDIELRLVEQRTTRLRRREDY